MNKCRLLKILKVIEPESKYAITIVKEDFYLSRIDRYHGTYELNTITKEFLTKLSKNLHIGTDYSKSITICCYSLFNFFQLEEKLITLGYDWRCPGGGFSDVESPFILKISGRVLTYGEYDPINTFFKRTCVNERRLS